MARTDGRVVTLLSIARESRGASLANREQLPRLGHTLERACPAILEFDARADGEIPCGSQYSLGRIAPWDITCLGAGSLDFSPRFNRPLLLLPVG